MEQLRAQAPADGDVVMDWEFEGDESDEESKLRAETRKILELPELPFERDLRAGARPRRPLAGGLDRDGRVADAGAGA